MSQDELRAKAYNVTQYLVNTSNRDGRRGKNANYNDARGAAKEIVELINSEVLSVLGELEKEYEKDVNSEWFSSSGGQVDLVSFVKSVKNRYKL